MLCPSFTNTADSKGNEWPRAYVVMQETSRGKVSPKCIQDWICQRVAKHKRLVGGVVFIETVPKLASGKIQRKVIKQWALRDAEEIDNGGDVYRARL